MKILCIARNYSEHIRELNNQVPDEPILFMKPDTALIKDDGDFYYPSFSKEINYEGELVIKICKEGKFIEEKFAHRYYDEIGVGIDFTARDVQKRAMEKGYPWLLAKGFNGSAPLSGFVDKSKFKDINSIHFDLRLNGEIRQRGNTGHMIHTIDSMIAYVSQFMTLKKGDLIFTGTPSGVSTVAVGDKLEMYLENELMLTCNVK